jgi:hypothetical protein
MRGNQDPDGQHEHNTCLRSHSHGSAPLIEDLLHRLNVPQVNRDG